MAQIHHPQSTTTTTHKEDEQTHPPNSSSSPSFSPSLNFKDFSSDNLHKYTLLTPDPQSSFSTRSHLSVPSNNNSSAAKRNSDYFSDRNPKYSQSNLVLPTERSEPRRHSSEIPMASANIAQVNFTSARDLRPHDDDRVSERISNKLSNIK